MPITAHVESLLDLGYFHDRLFTQWGCKTVAEYYMRKCVVDERPTPLAMGVQYGEIRDIKHALNLIRIIESRPLVLQ